MTDLYSEKSYKKAVKNRVSALQKSNRAVTLKKIAKRIKIQYTYLSKALNDPSTHLSQDRLFRVCKVLGLEREETDFLMLLREYETADDPEWGEHLFGRIEEVRKARLLNAQVQRFDSNRSSAEMRYLFDPLTQVVLASLFIPEYRKHPHLLAPKLGVTPERLHQMLLKLSDVGHIELDESGRGVKKILKGQIHYGRDHPLMRVHQNLLKTMIQSQLIRIPEEDKHSFLVTMNMDRKSFDEAKEEFQKFLKRLEEICGRSKDEGTYQLSFDLFRWV